ncbi:unnamed protein product, partial [Ectocarpus sp. 12 AP-2014]
PGIVVDVHLGTSDSVQSHFSNGAANLALFNETEEPAINAQRLFSEPLAWLMKKGGHAAAVDPLPLAIAEVRCSWRDAAVKALQNKKRGYRVAYSSDTSMGQLAALRADLAIAALPRSLINPELVEVPSDHGLPKLSKTHVYLADDGSKLSKVFASMVIAMIGRTG